jgi:hypothetical protein
LLVAAAGNDPQWADGAREILVGIINTLQRERKTEWSWPDLKTALELDDAALRDFACRFHPIAKRFMSLDGDQNFTKNAGSYVSSLMAPINKLIGPLAAAWGGPPSAISAVFDRMARRVQSNVPDLNPAESP